MSRTSSAYAPRRPLSLAAAVAASLAVLVASPAGASPEETVDPLLSAAVPSTQLWSDHAWVAQNRSSAKKQPQRKRITLDLQQADIHNVIRLIADVSGMNIVVGDEVKGTVTIKLKNVPWDEALRIILKTKQLGMVWEGDNLIRVALQADLDEERRRALEQADDCVKQGALKTKLVSVSYARASEMMPLIKATLTERGTVAVDERTNTIIIRDVACSPAFR
jgi:type II secretory pathway component HofQ